MERREQHTQKTLCDHIDTQLFMSSCIARLEIDGEPKRQGHGEITLEDQKITLTIIGNSGTSANFGELLKIKAEMTVEKSWW